MNDMNDLLKTTETLMGKVIANLEREFIKIRTGRAHPSILEGIKVPHYGNDVPLAQIASITVSDARTLSVTPWEKNTLGAIDKAIRSADLGLNPANNGSVLRIPLAPLTQETRKDFTRIAHTCAEESRIEIRKIRRDANQLVKNLLKDKKFNEDEEYKTNEQVQKLTDTFITEIDSKLRSKTKELLAL